MSIQERMVAILADLPAIGKTQRNQQQGFMYRGHDDVLNALNPLFAKHGVFVTPDVLERITDQRTTSKGGVMYEVNLHVRYTFHGADGDSISASAWGEGTDSGDKSTNKAMTMAFKNVLAQAFAISTTETIDADAHTPEETIGRTVQPEPPRDDRLAAVVGRLKELDPVTQWATVLNDDAKKTYKTPGGLVALDQGQRDHLAARLEQHADRLEAASSGGGAEPPSPAPGPDGTPAPPETPSAGEAPQAGTDGSSDGGKPMESASDAPAESLFKAPTGPRGSKKARA